MKKKRLSLQLKRLGYCDENYRITVTSGSPSQSGVLTDLYSRYSRIYL